MWWPCQVQEDYTDPRQWIKVWRIYGIVRGTNVERDSSIFGPTRKDQIRQSHCNGIPWEATFQGENPHEVHVFVADRLEPRITGNIVRDWKAWRFGHRSTRRVPMGTRQRSTIGWEHSTRENGRWKKSEDENACSQLGWTAKSVVPTKHCEWWKVFLGDCWSHKCWWSRRWWPHEILVRSVRLLCSTTTGSWGISWPQTLSELLGKLYTLTIWRSQWRIGQAFKSVPGT